MSRRQELAALLGREVDLIRLHERMNPGLKARVERTRCMREPRLLDGFSCSPELPCLVTRK